MGGLLPMTSSLLSKATARIIKFQQEELIDAMLDDILIEVVLILNAEEEIKRKKNESVKC